MKHPHVCPDCKHYWISVCSCCNQIVGHCRLNNPVHPLGSCTDYERDDYFD